ncbi:MAG: ABC transporter permease [Candidatus Omnitrophota bacterium]
MKYQSEFQSALRSFRQNRFAMICLWVLIVFYAGALFAGFLAPYSYDDEARDLSYAPPTAVHFFSEDGQWRGPYVYGINITFDRFHRRVYREDRSETHSLQFLVSSETFKFAGLELPRVRLFGVDAPGRLYLWGADSRGRDIFSRILYGGRISLSIGLIGVAISYVIGLLIGGIAGYYGGKIDNILMRVCEMFMMIPGFYLLLALRAVVPADFNSVQVYFSIVIILSFIGWAGLARIIRGMCLSLREREFVLAARVMGAGDLKIIREHILPHTLSYSVIAVMLAIPGYILAESALSLIGLGIQDPFASWGNMLAEAMNIVRIRFAPWILIPGGCIFVVVMCFNVVGDALRDVLDPQTRLG